MNYSQKKLKSGFTLIELLVVISVIGLLSGIVLQSLKSARIKSYNATRLSDIDQINKALELYLTKNTGKGLPVSDAGAPSSWKCIGLTTGTCWAGVYPAPAATAITPETNINLALEGNISKMPKDPFIASGSGDYYIYTAGTWVPAAVNWGTQPTGHYLYWYAHDVGSKPCGRGVARLTPSGIYRPCILYLGI